MNVPNFIRPIPKSCQLSTEPLTTRTESSSVPFPGPLTWVAKNLRTHPHRNQIRRSGALHSRLCLPCPDFIALIATNVPRAKHSPRNHFIVDGRTHRTPSRSSRRANNQKCAGSNDTGLLSVSLGMSCSTTPTPTALSATRSRKIASSNHNSIVNIMHSLNSNGHTAASTHALCIHS